MAQDCPGSHAGKPCTNVLADNAIVCNLCGWEAPKRARGEGQADRERRERNRKAMQASLDMPGPASHSLTEKQWYAVCKFFPNAARHAKRKFADVGPHNPLDSKVKLNPMFVRKTVLDIDELAEREAIQNAERELQELAQRRKREAANIDSVNAELSRP